MFKPWPGSPRGILQHDWEEQQVVLDQPHHDLGVLGPEPAATQHRLHELHIHLGVVARIALADIVEHAADIDSFGSLA